MYKTRRINDIFVSGIGSILHAVVVPLFAFVFVIIYHPFDMRGYLEMGPFPFIAHLAILFAILLVTMSLTRSLLYLVGRHLEVTRLFYVVWSFCEVVVSALFAALYVALMMKTETSFFDVARISLGIMLCIAVYPYLFLYFGLDSYSRYKEAETASEEESSSLIRFYDEYHKLKFIIASSAIVYIKSEDNYVRIFYLDQGRMKTQILRSSMRALEDTLARHGLVRCHRSFIINPEYVSMLHKDTSGALVLELNREQCESIPVSRKYQEEITKLL